MGQSCTELDAEVFSEVIPENFFTTPAQTASAASAAYTPLYTYWDNGEWMQDMPTNQSVMPTRSNFGWNDGGRWPALTTHQFPASDAIFNGMWVNMFGGISTCNRLIEIFTEQVGADSPGVAELRALRALYYWILLDLFGNIPIETGFSTADPSPSQSSPSEVYSLIVSELTAAIPLLSEDKGATYAKMNKWVANTLLAYVHLNANNYGAGDRWQDAANAANQVINSGAYSMESGYFANFRINNEGSSENIFVIPFDNVNTGGSFMIVGRYTHQSVTGTFGYNGGTSWGGVSIQEEFYNVFDENDKRLGMFFIGQQYTPAGGPQWSDDVGFFYSSPSDAARLSDCSEDVDRFVGAGIIDEFPPYMADCNIVLVPFYDFAQDDRTGYRNGARCAKWELLPGPAESNRMSNDFAVFRYAHVLLMRAEALWRQDAGSAEALMLLNQVRSRAGIAPRSEITATNLMQEIQQELAMELHSRPTQIRFDILNPEVEGTWSDPWYEGNSAKPATGPDRRLYPIPLEQLNANTNLSQNPGY